MSEVEEVLIGGVSHHIGLIDRDEEFLRGNENYSLIVKVCGRGSGEVDSFDDLVATASGNIDVDLASVRAAVYGVLDVLNF